MREKISVAELLTMKTQEIIEGVISEQFSVLEAFGAKNLKQEMKPIGLICGFFLKKIARHVSGVWSNLSISERYSINHRDFEIEVSREYVLKLLSTWAPVEIYGELPRKKDGDVLVIGFNHPTLGEIFRLLGVIFVDYPKDPVLFPVNLPWYEAIAPYTEYLNMMGVYIVPLITPSTNQKMERFVKNNESKNMLSHLTGCFLRYYAKSCCDLLRKGGGIIPVAPSATRQDTIFTSKAAYCGDDKVNSTIGFLATMLTSKNEPSHCGVLPVLVIPPERCNRRLNLFRAYRFYICEWFEPMLVKEFRRSPKNMKSLDYRFLSRISDKAQRVGAELLIYPQE